MAKEQKTKYVQIIVLSAIVLILAFSAIFTNQISRSMKKWLHKTDIKVSAEDLVVHYINVGQGDAIALAFPDDKIMLIDSGPKDSQNVLLRYLKEEVIKSRNELVIDYVILSHPDLDHSGGMCAVFAEFEVKNFFRPNIASDSENAGDFSMKSTSDEYDELIKISKKEKDLTTNIINKEFKFNIGKAIIEIFAPINKYDTTNAMSCVTKISYLSKSFLFTGDIQDESENDMLEHYGERLNADVLKVAHHGSKTSTSNKFIDVVSPDYAVICVGENNYGHPHFTTIANLNNSGAKVLSTKNSDIRIMCDGYDIKILSAKDVQSFEFIDWWKIALAIIIVVACILAKQVTRLIKYKKEQAKVKQMPFERVE